MSIKSLVFDIGGVILNTHIAPMATALKVPEEHVRNLYRTVKAADLWDDWMIGKINGNHVENQLIQLLPEEEELIRAWLNPYGEIMPPYAHTLDLIKRAKSHGKNIFFLSNIVDRTLINLRHRGILHEKSRGIYSCEVGLVKPDKEIYELLLDTYGLIADETLFFDDKPENIQGAQSVGINALKWQGKETVIPEHYDI